ncbi:MAG: CvpA family protein [Muricomes sp.]
MNNWLLIVVGVIFLIGIIAGYVRGFFKIALSLLSAALAIILMLILNPYVANALTKYTPLDELIEQKCIEMFMPEISAEQFAGIDLSGTPLEGLSAEQLMGGSREWEKLGITEKDILKILGMIPKDVQIKQIEDSALPAFLKNIVLENNNPAIYEELGVSSFTEYVAAYISRMVIKLISFLVTFLLVIIIINALMVAVDILGDLPGIGFLNRFAGGLAGIVGALLFVWLGFLVITVLYSTAFGKICFEMIDSSKILTFLYDKNILLQKLLKF